jgi:high affinity Mn2+ porin
MARITSETRNRATRARLVALAVVVLCCGSRAARAEVSEPSGHPDESFDFMNLLAHHGLHDLDQELWNAYGQLTFIGQDKLPFSPAYSNSNGTNHSLSPDQEYSFTGTATFYFGFGLWPGGEAYVVPEVIAERPLSGLVGLGSAIQNFELQKTGGTAPAPYLSRVYLRQTIGFGGGKDDVESDPMQLGRSYDKRRLVLTAGNFSVLDFFDKNTYSGDLRQQFFNMAFLTYAAFDFAADARGYAWGAMAELYWDDWAFRVGRMTPPKDPNQLPIDFRIYKYYGDQAEIEHDHQILGHPGAVRLLGYRNRENMGRFSDAVSAFEGDQAKNTTNCGSTPFGYDPPSANAMAPDLCFVRKPNVKVGVGLNVEQEIAPDVGLFFRGMYSDGQTEVYSFTSTDRSISLGVMGKGTLWHRGSDRAGIGYGEGWISSAHARYLAMGGIDGFIGDGKLTQAAEHVFEVFYSLNIASPLWVSLDYQHIWNPAYNADRGPVDIFGARVHAEF